MLEKYLIKIKMDVDNKNLWKTFIISSVAMFPQQQQNMATFSL